MNYLIFRDDGIGDLIVSTPLIKYIREIDKDSCVNLICSNRNIELANLLITNKLIDHLLNIDEYDTFSKKFSFYSVINSLNIDHIIILKSSNFSIYFSKLIKFINFKNIQISSIASLNSTKKGKDRYRPGKFIIDLIFDNYEVIDCRNDYEYSMNIQMLDHYSNLGNQIFKSGLKNNINDIPYFEPRILNINKEFIEITKNILNQKKLIIFHFDEKWNAANYSLDEIIFILDKFLESYDGFILMTNGVMKNKYYDQVINNYKFKDYSCPTQGYKVYISEMNKNFFSFPCLKLNELIYLISKSNLIVEPHGALTHIASIYDKPVIDLVPKDKINFLKKWKPRSKKNRQVIIDHKEDIFKNFNELIS